MKMVRILKCGISMLRHTEPLKLQSNFVPIRRLFRPSPLISLGEAAETFLLLSLQRYPYSLALESHVPSSTSPRTLATLNSANE